VPSGSEWLLLRAVIMMAVGLNYRSCAWSALSAREDKHFPESSLVMLMLGVHSVFAIKNLFSLKRFATEIPGRAAAFPNEVSFRACILWACISWACISERVCHGCASYGRASHGRVSHGRFSKSFWESLLIPHPSTSVDNEELPELEEILRSNRKENVAGGGDNKMSVTAKLMLTIAVIAVDCLTRKDISLKVTRRRAWDRLL
jgi:hypothetical protein